MIFNSIRWRLQIWYGLILIGVLAGFGFTAYQLQSGRQLRRVDGELQRRVNAIAGVVRPRPIRGPEERPPRPPNNRPPPGRGPDRFPGEPLEPLGPPEAFPGRGPVDFHLPTQLSALFDETDPGGYYYVVWWRDGRELGRSSNAPVVVPMPAREPQRGPPFRGPQPPRTRDAFREASLVTPGEIVLVGRSLATERAELRNLAWRLSGAGGLILLLGVAGGWWLATRAIRPIEEISATALKISGGDLSQRVNVKDTENELGRLAHVLNSTFARLETAFNQQQQFTSDAAHELRTPVSVMLTQTQAALNRERSAAEYRETVEACERAAQRMRRLIESLLELARLDAGQEPMKRAPVNLARLAADGIELVRPLAAGRGIAVRAELAEAQCQADPERLAQVVTNLLANAIHYNREGGEIRVATAKEKDFAVLSISDTGVGIPPEHLQHVFKRFYRADPARGGSEGRAGLGLAISKAIVDAHGGSIEVASTPGQGTTFTIRLPV